MLKLTDLQVEILYSFNEEFTGDLTLIAIYLDVDANTEYEVTQHDISNGIETLVEAGYLKAIHCCLGMRYMLIDTQ